MPWNVHAAEIGQHEVGFAAGVRVGAWAAAGSTVPAAALRGRETDQAGQNDRPAATAMQRRAPGTGRYANSESYENSTASDIVMLRRIACDHRGSQPQNKARSDRCVMSPCQRLDLQLPRS